METLEVEVHADTGKVWTDWIPADEIEEQKRLANEAGCRLRVVGRVSWQRQLSRMENNPE